MCLRLNKASREQLDLEARWRILKLRISGERFSSHEVALPESPGRQPWVDEADDSEGPTGRDSTIVAALCRPVQSSDGPLGLNGFLSSFSPGLAPWAFGFCRVAALVNNKNARLQKRKRGCGRVSLDCAPGYCGLGTLFAATCQTL